MMGDTYKYSSATIQIMMSDASYLQMLQDVPSQELLPLLKRVPKQKNTCKAGELVTSHQVPFAYTKKDRSFPEAQTNHEKKPFNVLGFDIKNMPYLKFGTMKFRRINISWLGMHKIDTGPEIDTDRIVTIMIQSDTVS